MKTLTTANYRLACEFIRNDARPVDQALFAWMFQGGKADAVWEALCNFANGDGGFGHGMEPDCQLPASSVLATITAFPYLIQTCAPADHPLVANGIQYLIDTYSRPLHGWHMLPPEVNNHPRAAWWNYDPNTADAIAHWGNPSAAVVAYLHRYSQWVPHTFLQEVTNKAMAVFAESLAKNTGHDYLPWIELAEALPRSLAATVWQGLKKQAAAAIVTDPAKWVGYGVRPLWAVPEPGSALFAVLEASVQAHLDFEIDQQQPDGSWHPFWSWGRFDEEWQRAKLAWQGVLTVKVLRSLRAFGRIA